MPDYSAYTHAAEQLDRFVRDAVAAQMAGRERREILGVDLIRSLTALVADEVEARGKSGPSKEEPMP